MHRDRDRAERRAQLVQSRDVVDVRVSEEDGLDADASVAREVDHLLWVEVGIDDHRIVRRIVLDQVGVGPPPPVGRDLDANAQIQEASRATVWTSLTLSSFSIRRESCASESISTVADTTAVLSS